MESFKVSNTYLKSMVPPAGIEPATPGLGKLFKGLYKGLKIPAKTLPVKGSSHILILM
jgi:hypothetical protein